MRLPRASYANVTSTLALLLAAAGGTAVAVEKINADKVDGVNAAKIDFVANAKAPPTPFKTILRVGGLMLQAKCVEQSGFFLEERARSTKNNAEIQIAAFGINQGVNPDIEYANDRDFDKGDPLEIPEVLQASANEVTVTYSTRRGSHVTATFQRDVGSVLGGGPRPCLIGGTALHSPP